MLRRHGRSPGPGLRRSRVPRDRDGAPAGAARHAAARRRDRHGGRGRRGRARRRDPARRGRRRRHVLQRERPAVPAAGVARRRGRDGAGRHAARAGRPALRRRLPVGRRVRAGRRRRHGCELHPRGHAGRLRERHGPVAPRSRAAPARAARARRRRHRGADERHARVRLAARRRDPRACGRARRWSRRSPTRSWSPGPMAGSEPDVEAVREVVDAVAGQRAGLPQHRRQGRPTSPRTGRSWTA